jgi:chromosomal replication initiator protein
MIEQLTGVDLKRLTVELAEQFPRQALEGVARSKKRNATVSTPVLVAGFVADVYNVSASDILGQDRSGRVLKARQATMSLLARADLIGLSLYEIGRALNGRDHTTILHGIEKMESEGAYLEPGYQEVLAILCEMLEVNYEEIKNVPPPRRPRGTR